MRSSLIILVILLALAGNAFGDTTLTMNEGWVAGDITTVSGSKNPYVPFPPERLVTPGAVLAEGIFGNMHGQIIYCGTIFKKEGKDQVIIQSGFSNSLVPRAEVMTYVLEKGDAIRFWPIPASTISNRWPTGYIDIHIKEVAVRDVTINLTVENGGS
jgi:hypothetical protein